MMSDCNNDKSVRGVQVCVSFKYFTRYLNETSEIMCMCMSIWRGVILVYLISVRNEIGSGEGHN